MAEFSHGFFAFKEVIMKQILRPVRKAGFFVLNKDPVKLTALLYLREALLREQYELCAEFVKIAVEFGANRLEIQNLLEDPRRMPKA